jgi:hypothetical protein
MVATHVKSGSTTEGGMFASLIVLTTHTLFESVKEVSSCPGREMPYKDPVIRKALPQSSACEGGGMASRARGEGTIS